MSSAASSPLTLDLRPAWVPLGALVVWLGLIAASVWFTELPFIARLATTLLTGGTAFFAVRGQLHGLSRRSLRRVRWDVGGRWTLTDATGRDQGAALSPATLIGQRYAVLHWQTDQGRCWALIDSRPDPAGFRRLRLRARFS